MAPPTLVAMAQRNLIRNLSSLQDVGDTPYEAVKPALRKIVDPNQLRTIEIASPHIADADAELWLAFIKRDVPDWKKKIVTPTNPRSWWKVYRKLYHEEKAAQKAQEKQLEEAMNSKKMEKEANQTHILHTVVQQKFRQKTFLDGNLNTRAGAFGSERIGTVASAKKNGTNIISAIRKASTKPTNFRAPVNKTPSAEPTQSRMWQTPIIPPGSRQKHAPNLLRRGPPTVTQADAQTALDRALRADEKIKGERAKRLSNSPPPLTAGNLASKAQSPSKAVLPTPPNTQSSGRSGPGSARPADAAKAKAPPAANRMSKVDQRSPQPTASPAVSGKTATPLGPGAGSKRPMSPEEPSAPSPAPPQKRQRPQTSIFMPKRFKR